MTDHACQCINPHMRPVPHPGHCCLRNVPEDFDRARGDRLDCHPDEWEAAHPQPDDRAPLPGQETLL